MKEGHVPIQESGVVSLQHHHASPVVCTILDIRGRGGTEPGGVPKMFSDFGSEGLI